MAIAENFYDEVDFVRIPFSEIILIIVYTIVCTIGGYYIEKRHSKFYRKAWTHIPVFTSFSIVMILIVESWRQQYIFQLITMQHLLLATILSDFGYIFGFILALVAKQPLSRIHVIAIETGSRTTFISSILVDYSVPEPLDDLAKPIPVLASILSVGLGCLVVLLYRIASRCQTLLSGDTVYALSESDSSHSDGYTDYLSEEEEEEEIIETVL